MRTKGEWEVKSSKLDYRTDIGVEFQIEKGCIITASGLITGINNKEDAEYICKTVNNHEMLIELSRKLLATICKICGETEKTCSKCEVIKEFNNILKLIGG